MKLTPSKALKEIGLLRENGCYIKSTVEYKIVEKALKDSEWYKQRMIKFEKAFTEENEEKLKLKQALDIIKEKKVSVLLLNFCFKVEEYNWEVSKERRLTQEEFDLLKEVLK